MSSEILMAGDTGSMDLTDDRTRNSITDPPMVVIDNESSKDATIIQGIEQKEIIQSMNKGKGIMGLDDNLVETTEERFAWSRSESLMDKHADPIANCYQQVNYKVDEGLITGDELNMGGKSSKETTASENGYLQQQSPRPCYTPRHHHAPASYSYGVPTPRRTLDRKYSRIADNYQTLEQVTAALAQAGLESSNHNVGIDFRKSNEWTGARSFNRRRLHNIGAIQNPYEQAISIIGKTLSLFDEDNLIPCFGFGDASIHDQDVFSFYPDSSFCNGSEDVLRRYREIAPRLRLSEEKYQSMEIEKEQVRRSSSYREVDEEEDVPLSGFRFHPTDEELVGFYLRRKVEKKPISIELIKQIDIYKYDPWDLPKSTNVGDKEWYFFCRRERKYRNSIRPNRVTGSGFWKATGIDRPIYSATGSVCIGLKKSLVYYRGSAGKGTKTDWMMHEFRLPPSSDHNVVKHVDDKFLAQEAEVWTLCRIFERNICHRRTLPEWREVSGKRNPVVDASSKTCSGDNSDHDIPIREALCCLSDQGKHSNRRRSSQRFTGHNKKKDQSNHEDVHDIRINIDDAAEFATTADWHDQIIEEDGKRRIVFRYKLPDSKTKVCEIILGIAGQAAAGFATNVLASKSNSSHPQVYTVVGATAVAFVGTLTSLSLGKKSPKWAGIFGKVGAAAAVLGTMVGLGMYLPDHQVLISGIVATIPVLVVAFA